MIYNIIIADDHQLMLDGLSRIIKNASDFNILALARNGVEVLDIIRSLTQRPSVILMDIDMPVLNGIDTTRQLKLDYPEVKVLLLTMHDANTSLNKAIAVHADGLITKASGQDELLYALRQVCNGRSHFSNEHKTSRQKNDTSPSNQTHLSVREIEILKKIAQGHSNSQISELLNISIRTVDTHRTNIKKKISAKRIAELVRYAYQNGLL